MKYFISILLFISLTSSCLKPVSYPETPEITFTSFEIFDDGTGDMDAQLKMKFTDGDGDIGLRQSDTTGVFCNDSCLYNYNVFCEYYEKQNGDWVHIELPWQVFPQAFYYRIPDVSPTGQNPALSGEIKILMDTYYLSTYPGDTCRFEVHMVDRKLHHSNTITTSEFTKQ